MPAKFSHLLRRTFRTECRMWRSFLVELGIVVFLFSFIVVNPITRVTNWTNSNRAGSAKIYDLEPLDSLKAFMRLKYMKRTPIRLDLAYAPNTHFADSVMQNVVTKLKMRRAIPFESDGDMFWHISMKNTLAGITFAMEAELPKYLDIRLRFPAQLRTVDPADDMDKFWFSRCNGVVDISEQLVDEYVDTDLYIREGFAQLQNEIFLEWLTAAMAHEKVSKPVPVILARPYWHTHTSMASCMYNYYDTNFEAYMCFAAFLLPFLNMLWKFGRERENYLDLRHWRYGYQHRTYWLSHFLVSTMRLLPLDISLLVITLVPWSKARFGGTIIDVSPAIPFAYLLLHSMGLVLFAIFVVILVPRAKSAVLVGFAIWFFFNLITVISLDNTNLDLFRPSVLVVFIIFYNNSISFMYLYLQNIALFETRWEIYILFACQLAHILLLLIGISIALDMLPGKYLRRLPYSLWGLCDTCNRYRLLHRLRQRERRPTDVLAEPTPSLQDYEDASASALGPEEYMCVRNVCTGDGGDGGDGGLKNVSLRLFKGEITVILGHYTGHMTTLIRVMAGWLEPTSGFVRIRSQDIYDNWTLARHWIDVMMSNETLYAMLTVRETIYYFVRVKLHASDEDLIEVEMLRWMHMLQPVIAQPEKVLVKHLTFEQQRLVCLCCVLAGGTSIVLLDESAVYMRAEEMRYFWSLLKHEKADRAIVLTSFSLDEAEEVADRIAILDKGVVQAYGTPFYLKTNFGSGYNLIILKRRGAAVEPITAVLERHMTGISLNAEVGDQLYYKLTTAQRPLFQKLLIDLEQESEDLGIDRIHMLGSELSEVYMSLSEESNTQHQSTRRHTFQSKRPPKRVFTQRTRKQFRAVFVKRIRQQVLNWVPAAMMGFGLVYVLFVKDLSDTLHIAAWNNDSAHLGFMDVANLKWLDPMRQCRVIHINSVDSGWNKLRENQKSYIFTANSFSCGEATENYFKNPHKLPKLGLIELNDNVANFWYNKNILHTVPLAMNLLHNALVRQYLPEGYGVRIGHHPVHTPLCEHISFNDQLLSHLRATIIVGIIIPAMAATFIYPLAEERANHMLFVQVMAGLNMAVYWLVNLLWDWLILTIYCVFILLILCLVKMEGFDAEGLLVMFLLLLVYSLPAVTLTYLVSLFKFSSPLYAYITALVVQLSGWAAYLFYWDVMVNSTIFYWTCIIIPGFAMLDATADIYTTGIEKAYCEQVCIEMDDCKLENICEQIPQCCSVLSTSLFFHFVEGPGILMAMTFLMLSFFLMWIIIFFIELMRKENQYGPPKNYKKLRSATFPYDDEDVVTLKQRLGKADIHTYRQKRLVVDQLELHRGKDEVELHTVSFDLDSHSCLGIMGTAVAGKTELLQQLAGEKGFSFGDVYIMGLELKYSRDDAHEFMSYWPQGNVGFEYFTPYRLMRYIGRLRGYEEEELADIMQEQVLALNLHRDVDRRIAFLNAEKRRKLGLAIALMGENPVVLLDEPTRGVSARVRKEIWKVLRHACQQGRSIVLVTCDTSECQELADRMLVYDQGEMWAIGSAYYLRNKYTYGFYLEVEVRRDESQPRAVAEANFRKDVENLHRFVAFLHEESVLRSKIDNRLRFYVPVDDVVYSYLYGTLEKNMRRLNITNYFISQGSMEDMMRKIGATRRHRDSQLHFVAFPI